VVGYDGIIKSGILSPVKPPVRSHSNYEAIGKLGFENGWGQEYGADAISDALDAE
jgi:hypothetical protein